MKILDPFNNISDDQHLTSLNRYVSDGSLGDEICSWKVWDVTDIFDRFCHQVPKANKL